MKKAKKTGPEYSKREREIMALLWEGKTNREVAVLLDISQKTVESHGLSIRKRMNVRNRTEMLRAAIKLGLIRSEKVA